MDAQGKVVPKDINIDGEDFVFENFVKYSVLHNEIDIIVDLDWIFETQYKVHEEIAKM